MRVTMQLTHDEVRAILTAHFEANGYQVGHIAIHVSEAKSPKFKGFTFPVHEVRLGGDAQAVEVELKPDKHTVDETKHRRIVVGPRRHKAGDDA